ncbi:MAG: C-GCAxxG-C-C family protein [Limnochordia bacterium]|nr:C-GCAxxG-C-C family protein [Limnochordia bacterium]
MGGKTEIAFGLFNGGFNCAQSVVGPFFSVEDGDAQLALKLASGFGGGMRSGEVCGAVTGAVMVIGSREGQCRADDLATKRKCSELTSKFMEEYAKRKGTLLCRELLGYDVRDHEAAAKCAGNKREVCEGAIKTAILLLEEMGIE